MGQDRHHNNIAEAIRALTGNGHPCALLAPNSKIPRKGTRGFLDATTDADALLAELAREPLANLCVDGGTRLVFLDVDVKNGKRGDVTLVELIRDNGGMGWTRQVRTPSGGAHYWFLLPSGATIGQSVDKLGIGLDVRTNIVAPPSRVNGAAYEWVDDGAELCEPAPWLLRMMIEASAPKQAPQPVSRPAASRWIDDVGKRADRAMDYIKPIGPAIAGQGGHEQTYRVAQHLAKGFSLPHNIALEILNWYNSRCEPPWSKRELEHKLASAYKARIAEGYLLGDDR